MFHDFCGVIITSSGEEAWQTVGGKGADFENNLERFSNKKIQTNSLFFEFCLSYIVFILLFK